MHIFVNAPCSNHVNYDTGEIFPDYKEWLINLLSAIETTGHSVFCALRADNYKINDSDPVAAFNLDVSKLEKCDVIIAILNDNVSVGVQTEIGYAAALGKKIVFAHEQDHVLKYFNNAMVQAGAASVITLPLTEEKLEAVLAETVRDQ